MDASTRDRIVCFMCKADAHDEFLACLVEREQWSCSTCGCNRVVAERFYQEDFDTKIAMLRTARGDLQRRTRKLQERARADATAAVNTRIAITGSDVVEMLERALSECQVGAGKGTDAYLGVFFNVLRQSGVDVDGVEAAVGLATCWRCRRPISESLEADA